MQNECPKCVHLCAYMWLFTNKSHVMDELEPHDHSLHLLIVVYVLLCSLVICELWLKWLELTGDLQSRREQYKRYSFSDRKIKQMKKCPKALFCLKAIDFRHRRFFLS